VREKKKVEFGSDWTVSEETGGLGQLIWAMFSAQQHKPRPRASFDKRATMASRNLPEPVLAVQSYESGAGEMEVS
jgi:hypothetical protein